jgi:hypothetical protein
MYKKQKSRASWNYMILTSLLGLLSSSIIAAISYLPQQHQQVMAQNETTTFEEQQASAQAAPINSTTSPALGCNNLTITNITASGSQASNPPKNAIDNNFTTYWSKNSFGAWIQADLGDKKMICNVDIAWYKGNERSSSFVISVSNDGISFKDVFKGKSTGKTVNYPERYNFTTADGRYVEITVNGNTANNYAAISEIKIQGGNSTSTTNSTARG